ncbi:hypothetical protein OS493_022498 [Desmophyllum pertusum]|uniref:G-protein coupled receptors family 1 profile domain-containing protein n=1 Tax=Desmophyllum pertusum TaxID=174260 RepID=A0A9W9ZBP3_9CNID|nr:hypothetical protein OS493_022498 [Desmophyllum pertusum]
MEDTITSSTESHFTVYAGSRRFFRCFDISAFLHGSRTVTYSWQNGTVLCGCFYSFLYRLDVQRDFFLTLSAVSIERYLALRFHLRYTELITTTRVVITVIIYWLIWVTCITLLWFWVKDKLFTYILVAFCFLILTVVTRCYVTIFKTVKRHNKQIQDSQLQQGQESIFRYRRTTNTMVILISAFVLSYFPFIITTAISASQAKEDMKTSAAHCFAVAIISANSTANPLIYFWRVEELREAAKQTLRKCHLMTAKQSDVELEPR